MNPGNPCDVSTGPCEADDHSRRDWIDPCEKHDWDCLGGALGYWDGRRSRRENYINFEIHQPGGSSGKVLRSTRQAIFDLDALALNIPEVAKPFPKAIDEGFRKLTITQEPDAVQLRGLLCLGRERRGEEAASDRN